LTKSNLKVNLAQQIRDFAEASLHMINNFSQVNADTNREKPVVIVVDDDS
jgi:hypothetical protein